jgi:predicted lipoprotein with Yx(FWY)xxD motif
VRNPSALAAATLVLAGIAVAGCGSSSSSSGNAGNGYPATTHEATSTSAAAAASGGASAGNSKTSSSGGSGTVVTTGHTSLGPILAAGPKRLTVYLFAADTGSTSTCSGACAQAWPPVTTTGEPQAQGGAVAGDLGTTTRAEGTKQVTYKGHPLYYYVTDQQAGETTGQGVNSFGAPWYVLSPQGSEIR